jgi:hypothetical protein
MSKIDDFLRCVATDTSAQASYEFRRLLVAQAMFETGRFTSNLWKNHNSAFGIIYVRQPQAVSFITRQSDNFKFATYANVCDSVSDRFRIANIFSRDVINSTDTNKILDNWLINYLGYNASETDKRNYKNNVLKLYDEIPTKYPSFDDAMVTIVADKPTFNYYWIITIIVILLIYYVQK